ncbi:glycosyltransferase family 9 protein [Kineosporia succinea]|uniref:Uncharacterized protein n=1 Tax=Kineosporia succinea TaxID=84632 RepID=A0ABT9P0V4_9ACTN|nr:hypothetical protein [Kineosporia succinea]MDP9826142.1 hypothetical protein [Kineosporia succinea]
MNVPAEALTSLAPRGRINRILWLHRTDRWYLGDFLRHASWLHWAREAFPQAEIDLASHPAYLPLYADGRFGQLHDSRSFRGEQAYDLVIEPGSFEPGPSPAPLRLASWDAAWSVQVGGRAVMQGRKHELNYFRAAHPGAVTGDRSTTPTSLSFGSSELEPLNKALEAVFPGEGPVVVYNPSASNAFTRETGVHKEVDNSLTPADHIGILRHLLTLLPDHHFVIGAAVKRGDAVNESVVTTVAEAVAGESVCSTVDLGATSLCDFARLLAAPRICGTVGSGTGTNTHLAALLDRHALSFERGCDEAMLNNWSGNGFQMGSFRWRNPSAHTGIHTMSWARRDLLGAARAFVVDHAHVHGHEPDPSHAARHYGDFTDEAAYLGFRHGIPGRGLEAVLNALEDPRAQATARFLVEDSNLHKLVSRPGRST